MILGINSMFLVNKIILINNKYFKGNYYCILFWVYYNILKCIGKFFIVDFLKLNILEEVKLFLNL